MAIWALHDAKAKLGEVVDRALSEGPQEVTRRGRPAVVIVAKSAYDEAVAHAPAATKSAGPKMSFGEFLLTMPQGGPDDLFDRPPSVPRDIDF